jgi:hypothetical protein
MVEKWRKKQKEKDKQESERKNDRGDAMEASVVCKTMCLMPQIRRASRTVLTSGVYLPLDELSEGDCCGMMTMMMIQLRE